jgi:hypothetical protein
MELSGTAPVSVTQVLVDDTLLMAYTGSVRGTGVVTLSLPAVNSLAGQTLMNVIVDKHGRVLGGTPTGLNDYILNQSNFQDANFNIRDGTVVNLTITESLNLTTPLGVTSGGSGVNSVAPSNVFIGNESTTGAPGWRRLLGADMPAGVLNSEIPYATVAVAGLMIVGSGLSVVDGVVSSAVEPYTLPVASVTTLGGVKIGSGIHRDVDGTISTTKSRVVASQAPSTDDDVPLIYASGAVTNLSIRVVMSGVSGSTATFMLYSSLNRSADIAGTPLLASPEVLTNTSNGIDLVLETTSLDAGSFVYALISTAAVAKSLEFYLTYQEGV